MRLAKRTVIILLILFGLTFVLVLPGLPVGRAAITSRVGAQKAASSGLDSSRQAAMEKLYSQFQAGDRFSEEEGNILRKFGAGAAITNLEADLVISRALFDYYVAAKEITKEQQQLLDEYSMFVARRSSDVADLKTQLLNQRIAAAAAAPPRTTPLAPPPNDTCAGAEVIPGEGSFPYLTAVTANITDATPAGDPPFPSCQNVLSRSIWYSFTPSATATYTISSCASDGTGTTVDDTVMAIYTSTSACGPTFSEIPTAGASEGCDDDGCVSEGFQATIKTLLNAGTQYYIVVWQFGSAAPTAGNTAVQLRVSKVTPPANDACASPTALSLNIPVSGTTAGANPDYQSESGCFTGVGQEPSTAPGRDVVYSFLASTADNYSFRVTNYIGAGTTVSNLVVYVATSCPPVMGSCLKAANRANTVTAEDVNCVALGAGQQVFIFVDENIATLDGNTFTIEVTRCNPESEPNDTPATANIPFFGGEGSITPPGDVDFFSLGTPAAGSRVFALIDGIASNNGTDFDMRVTTAVDTLEYDDFNADVPFGSASPAIAGTPLTGAASFLRINYFPATGGAHAPYRIYSVVQPPGANTLSCMGPASTSSATPETEPNNVIANANTAGNKYFSGALPGPALSTDVDIFSFTANAGELIFLGLDGDPCRNASPINARLELLDSLGATLITVDDAFTASETAPGAGSLSSTTPFSPGEALVWRPTTTGTYYARVTISPSAFPTTGAGDYLLSIFTGGPTAAKFSNDAIGSAARATRFDDGVSVRWRTGFETDNLGFNVYREENGKRRCVNSQLIAGSALMVGAGTSLGAGRSYAWFDNAPASRSTQYFIEAVDLNGESTWHGPISSNQEARISSTGEQSASPTLGALGKSSPIESRTTRVDRRANIRTVSSSGVSIQGVIGAQPAAKLMVKSEGFYRVTQPELAAAGFNTQVDPRYLRLIADGQEQPINVIYRGGVFDSSSAIEFYGLGVDSASTDEHVYWLTIGTQAGQRIQSVSARAKPGFSQSFLSSIELKPRSTYFAGLRNGEKENFFGAVIARDRVDQVLTLQHVDVSPANGAMLEVALQGVTMSGHRVEVQINGARAGEVVFNGQDAGVARLAVSQSLLREGANLVSLLPLGGPADISLVDYLRLTYWHTFVADNDELRFNISAKQPITVEEFSNADIRVFDVTNPNAPQEVLGVITPKKSGYSVAISVPGSGLRTLVAMTNDRAMRLAGIALDRPSNWRQSTNEADLVIFTRGEFMLAANQLKEFRQSQGYKVAVVDIEDVYDEFSFGNKTPRAIKDFLAYAYSSWKVAPRFVMLVGDASFDAKNYLGFGWNDLVPTSLIDTQLMETASDDWLADFDGDGLAEMAIGRLPVRSPREAAVIVSKIISYDQSSRSEGVLLVADESLNGADFETTNAELRRLIPDDQRVEEINRGGLDPATAKSRLFDAINRGQRVINYNGHGNSDSWRGNFLTAEDVSQLSNGDNLSLFVMMTCLNGYFHDAQLDSLAEALLAAEKGGAIALWASSAMTNPGDQGVMDIEMFKRLFDPDTSLTLGEISLHAKKKGLNKDARLSWVLFGDPTTRLR